MTKPNAAPKDPGKDSAPVTWRQVQDAQKKRDKAQAEATAAVDRFASAEAELILAIDRLDRAMAAKESADAVKP